MMSSLKTCPFCGGVPEARQSSGTWWVECLSCRCASAGERTSAAASERWNRRTTLHADGSTTAPKRGDALSASSIRRQYPGAMPAQAAMRVIGVSRNTFFSMVKDGRLQHTRTSQNGRRNYLTASVLQCAGME